MLNIINYLLLFLKNSLLIIFKLVWHFFHGIAGIQGKYIHAVQLKFLTLTIILANPYKHKYYDSRVTEYGVTNLIRGLLRFYTAQIRCL